MDFTFSEEQELLRDSAKDFLARSAPLLGSPAVADSDAGFNEALWPQIAQMGWLDTDLGIIEQAVLMEETAAALLPAPLFSTLLVTPILATDPTLHARVAEGDLRIALAWCDVGRPTTLSAPSRDRLAVDSHDRVTGRKTLVADATCVDAFVAEVDHPAGSRFALVAASDAVVTPRDTIDRTRRFSEVEFTSAACSYITDTSPEILMAVEQHALTLAASEALGIARAALEVALAHARERNQFGKPIGTYQAVSHRIVDAYADAEIARSLVYWAVQCLETRDCDAVKAVPAAKAAATAAAVRSCESAIQVMGGVGMTWEHIIHRLYKRALWLDSFIAGQTELYRRVANQILDTAAATA